MLYHGNCLDYLKSLESGTRFPLIFADIPDNIGMQYPGEGFVDSRPDREYYSWVRHLIYQALHYTPCLWISYNAIHDLGIKQNLGPLTDPFEARTFIWRYTFGQYRDADCGNGYRPMLRILNKDRYSGLKIRPDNIRVESERMKQGDKRAAGPRVPDDVFEFPRVVGNSAERKPWFCTQHPEALMRRIIALHTDPGDMVLDLCAGSGTTRRAAKTIGRECTLCELSSVTCEHIIFDQPVIKVINSVYTQGNNNDTISFY